MWYAWKVIEFRLESKLSLCIWKFRTLKNSEPSYPHVFWKVYSTWVWQTTQKGEVSGWHLCSLHVNFWSLFQAWASFWSSSLRLPSHSLLGPHLCSAAWPEFDFLLFNTSPAWFLFPLPSLPARRWVLTGSLLSPLFSLWDLSSDAEMCDFHCAVQY